MATAASGDAQQRERGVPVMVWVLTAIFAVRALLTVIGAFIFAFPIGGPIGTSVGVILLVIAVAYAVIAWRMRYGERAIWFAAIAAPLVNQIVLTVTDLSLYGAIPPEDYPFIVVTIVVLVLLFLPSVRRFFTR